MTKEEAIKQFESELKWAELNTYPYVSKQKIEADKMAIKALEQEPCEDAISRQAVLEIVERVLSKGDALFEIEQLTSVNPQEPKWIPVGERLPEDQEVILVSTKTDRVFEGRYYDDNSNRQWYSFRDDTFAWNNVVTAWMPLPPPYKAESEDKNELL